MVEVFKTNVEDPRDAGVLIVRIQEAFIDYKVNFDLEDCDKILRIKSSSTFVQPMLIINILRRFGFEAIILPHENTSVLPITFCGKQHNLFFNSEIISVFNNIPK